MKGTISINSKDIRHHHAECNSAVERHKMEKNADKIMLMIDKPRERTADAIGVSLRKVDRVYLESQSTCVHIYHSVNTHTHIYMID